MTPPPVWAIVLAAGMSSRMKDANKLLMPLRGEPILAQTLNQVTQANFVGVLVVTGHRRGEIEKLAAGFPVHLAYNPNHADGLSTSIRTGISALPKEAKAAAIVLGDMPLVTTATYNRLITRVVSDDNIIVPAYDNRQGNPKIWGRAYFTELAALSGDSGARQLLEKFGDHVNPVAIADPAVHIDFDTPESFFDYEGEN